jgi:small subunit ribosomal protein S5
MSGLHHPVHPHFSLLDTGRRCHHAIAEICRCLGISDISAEVHGSANSINVLHAFMEILRRQKTPEAVALETGLHVDEVRRVYQFGCVPSK